MSSNSHESLYAQAQALFSAFFFSPKDFRRFHFLFDESLFFDKHHRWLFKELKRLDKADEPLDESFLNYGKGAAAEARREEVMQILGTNPIATSQEKRFEIIALNLKRYKREHDYLELARKLEDGEIEFESFEQELEKSLATKESFEKREAPNELDVEILSPYLKSAFLNLKAINDYPDSMVLATLLSSLGGLIGARAKIDNGANVNVFPVVWSLIIAPSSISAKSTLFEFSRKLVFGNIERDFEDDYREERKKWAAESESERGDAPMLKQLCFPIDSTPEAKIKALLANPNGGIIYHDEFKAELEKCNANLAYKALKTSLFDGRKYKKELVTSGAIILNNPCLSEVGAITQNWLFEAFQKSDIASGFLARYLFSYNKKEDFKPLKSKEIHLNTREFVDISKRFLDYFKFERDKPKIFELEFLAKQYYREWFNELSKTAYETESDEELTITYRLTTYALKFALISFIMNETAKENNTSLDSVLEIPVSYLEEGIELMNFFRAESDRALRAFKESGQVEIDMDSVLQRIYKRVAREENGILETRKLLMSVKGLRREALDIFLESGQLKEIKIDKTMFISVR